MNPLKHGPYNSNASSRDYVGPGHAVRIPNNDQHKHDQERLVLSSEPRSFDDPHLTQQSSSDGCHTYQQEKSGEMLKPPGIIGKIAIDCITEAEMNQPATNRQMTQPPPGFINYFHENSRYYDQDEQAGLHRHRRFDQDQASSLEYLKYRPESLAAHTAPSDNEEESHRINVNFTADISSQRDDNDSSLCNESKSDFIKFAKERSNQQATNKHICKPPPGFGFEMIVGDKSKTDILLRKDTTNYDDKPEHTFKTIEYADKDTESAYRADAKFEADTQRAIALSKQDQSKETFLETDIDLAFALSKQDFGSKNQTSSSFFTSKGYDNLQNDNSSSGQHSHMKMDKLFQEDIERAKTESLETFEYEKQKVSTDADVNLGRPFETSSNNEQNSGKKLKKEKSASDKERQEAISKAKNWTTHDYDCYDYRSEKEYQTAIGKFVYFWRNHDIYSQWHKSKFYVNGIKFNCAEKFMMYRKAELFEDKKIAKKILGEKDPRRIKALGREVKGFSEEMWAHNCLHIVKDANIAKFSQDAKMKEELFSTYPKILVEASPYDKIWGIGFAEDDCEAWDQKKWRGKNWLGYILTEVRDEMMAEEGIIEHSHKKVYLDGLIATELKKYTNQPDTTPKEKNQSSDLSCQKKKKKNKNAKIKNVKGTENCITKNSKIGKVDTEFENEEKLSSDKIIPELKKHEQELETLELETHKQEFEAHKQELETGHQEEASKLPNLDKCEEETQNKPEPRNQSLDGLDQTNGEGNLDILAENTQAKQDKNQDKSSAGYGQVTSLKLTEYVDNHAELLPEIHDMSDENVDIVSFEGIKEANDDDIDKVGVCDKKPIPRSCWTESTQINRNEVMQEPVDSFEASSDNDNANNLVKGTNSENNDLELI